MIVVRRVEPPAPVEVELLSASVTVNMTERQKAMVRSKASAKGMSMSAFMLRAALPQIEG